MGVHYLNRAITGFNIQKPQILVYVTRNGVTQLGALEWVFATQPPKPPLPGATYGTFDAACHYTDGQVIRNDQNERSSCALNHPITNAPLLFEHGPLVTLHVWLWYPNPEGIYHSTNPLIRPYN